MSAHQKWVGQALERTEDHRLITKGGHFIDDLTLPGVAHAAYVRSPHARAKIRHIDVRRAIEHPGVYALITGDEVAQLTRPQRGRVPLPNSPKVYALASQEVRYVGEPVVGIAAVDRATAEDAADLVMVEIDELPIVLDASGPPGEYERGHSTEPAVVEKSYGDVDAAFRAAHAVVELDLTVGRHSGVPLETRGAIGRYDAARGILELHGAAKVPHRNQELLARMLGLAPYATGVGLILHGLRRSAMNGNHDGRFWSRMRHRVNEIFREIF